MLHHGHHDHHQVNGLAFTPVHDTGIIFSLFSFIVHIITNTRVNVKAPYIYLVLSLTKSGLWPCLVGMVAPPSKYTLL